MLKESFRKLGLTFLLFTMIFSVWNITFPNSISADELTENEVNDIPENVIRIYYDRADEEYDNWGLWTWGDVATPSELVDSWPTGATPFSNDQVGEHGAYVDIELKEDAASIYFLVINRETGEKDGDQKFFNKLNDYNEVFVSEGDDIVGTSPGGTSLGNSNAHFPEWSKDAVIYEVNVRQYTSEGTFKAFEEHLPRLKNLGIDILWFMPIHPISEEKRIGSLGSYYAIQDYKAVNPEFGSMEDFKSLVDKAHDMGFKVMLDWVANHTGWDNVWIENKDWYTQDSKGNIVQPPGTTWEDVADLNFSNENMRAEMIDSMKYWVEEANIDGYRADYAGGVPVEFWEKATEELNKIKPLYMLAEDNVDFELLNNAFSLNYGWELSHTMVDIANGTKSADDIKSYFEKSKRVYPMGSYAMHWTSNHDDNSWEGTTSELFGEAHNTMAALTFTLPGIPLIYSGQEAGLDKRLAFFDKDEISWEDLSMQTFYRDLINLKKKNPALWNGLAGGDIHFLETTDNRILAFERSKGNSKVIVVVNLSPESVTGSVTVDPESVGKYFVYASQEDVELVEQQPFDLEPWGYKIMESDSINITWSELTESMNDYIENDEVTGPLVKQLTNKNKQAVHQFEKDSKNQSIKFLEDYLFHLNHKSNDRNVTPEAKEVLNKLVDELILYLR